MSRVQQKHSRHVVFKHSMHTSTRNSLVSSRAKAQIVAAEAGRSREAQLELTHRVRTADGKIIITLTISWCRGTKVLV